MGVLTTGYLMVNSWTDWRRKEVDIVWTVAVFVLTAFIYVGTDQKLCWSGLLPGICLWLASLWRSDQIGSGDGIVLMGIGWIQGIQQACVIFQTAILLAAAVGVCLIRPARAAPVPMDQQDKFVAQPSASSPMMMQAIADLPNEDVKPLKNQSN